ncbi:hypothetical protein LIN78_09645 [Leeia sp. TBRC 13508]|uniref:Uncharacterized protein n=1 Tax=Leeia speluncae TaxID=2884804 RepID=A0ABS8D703_9NEIS|nr:hypothetical protein [Leeia speluncae]MCB6183808.1 hypothetical protein [Leeia speluncae]
MSTKFALIAATIVSALSSSAMAADAAAVKEFRDSFYNRCMSDNVFKDIENLMAGINASYDEQAACTCLADRTAKVPGIVDALEESDQDSKKARWATLKIYEMTFTCSTEVAKKAEKSLR